jgi:hypothetical protein
MFYWKERQQGSWIPTKAKSLAAAKRIAARNQLFQGTVLIVGEADGDSIDVKSVRECDPIDMGLVYRWTDIT